MSVKWKSQETLEDNTVYELLMCDELLFFWDSLFPLCFHPIRAGTGCLMMSNA